MNSKDKHFGIFGERILNPVVPKTTEVSEFAPICADGCINAPAAKAQSHLSLEWKNDFMSRMSVHRRLGTGRKEQRGDGHVRIGKPAARDSVYWV
jgi:hypothetical protein